MFSAVIRSFDEEPALIPWFSALSLLLLFGLILGVTLVVRNYQMFHFFVQRLARESTLSEQDVVDLTSYVDYVLTGILTIFLIVLCFFALVVMLPSPH